MSGFKNLPRADFAVLVGSLLLLSGIFAASFYIVYFQTVEETVEFKVFDTTVHYWPEIRMNQTQVLTWGTGKYYFVGTWTNQFQVDHSYRVTYTQMHAAKRPWQNLIVVEWEEIA